MKGKTPSDKLRTYGERTGEGQGWQEQGGTRAQSGLSWTVSMECRVNTLSKGDTSSIKIRKQGGTLQAYGAPASLNAGKYEPLFVGSFL